MYIHTHTSLGPSSPSWGERSRLSCQPVGNGICVYTCVYIYIYIHLCMCVCVYISLYIYIYICIERCIYREREILLLLPSFLLLSLVYI